MTSAENTVYLDYNATTPVDPKVFKAMEPYFEKNFGNPASVNHGWGWTAQSAVKKARQQVANFLNAKPSEITFTSGATEGNNWVIFGLLHALKAENPNEEIHFITTQSEHNSILKPLVEIEKIWKDRGVSVTYLPVNNMGMVELSSIEKEIRPSTKLISAIWINNEIGSINDIENIGRMARDHKIYFHTDATQALGKVKINLTNQPIDLLTFSGHKIYGPKGIGGAYIRGTDPSVTIAPLLFGGGQEVGGRSGTLNVPGVVGLGAACEVLAQEMHSDKIRIEAMRDELLNRMHKALPKSRLNGPSPGTKRAYNNINFTFTELLDQGRDISNCSGPLSRLGSSAGSACTTGKFFHSHVLKGIGLTNGEAQCTLRLSLGRFTSQVDIDRAFDILIQALKLEG